jgi:hypothetical protein
MTGQAESGNGKPANNIVVNVSHDSEAIRDWTGTVKSNARSTIPITVFAWTFTIYLVFFYRHGEVFHRAFGADPRGAVVIVAGTIYVLTLVVLILLSAQRLRVSRVRGRLWTSGTAIYIGPTDTGGVAGSSDFFLEHKSDSVIAAPVVHLLLRCGDFLVVPSSGPNRHLYLPFRDVARVEIVLGGKDDAGVIITTHDSRKAEFACRKMDDSLMNSLGKLGAQIVHAAS